ncbi:MAG: hypothetical protein U0168_25405 [Nannocystaceae bacterium]
MFATGRRRRQQRRGWGDRRWHHAAAAGRAWIDVDAALARSDSDAPLLALGDRIVTGPTRTNVCDLAIAWIDPIAAS